MKLLWVSPRWPLPADDGAKQASSQLIRGLTNRGVSIHLLCAVGTEERLNPDQARGELKLTSVDYVRVHKGNRLYQALGLLLHPTFPITLSPFLSRRLAAKISAFVEANSDCLIVFDGLAAASCRYVRTFTAKHVYRAHNCEYALWERAAQSRRYGLTRAFLKLQAGNVRAVEEETAKSSLLVLPVSEADKAHFDEMTERGRVISVPIGMRVPERAKDPETRLLEMLFVGRLDWPPNRDGLKWFLDSVWPRTINARPAIHLTIVGSGFAKWLEDMLPMPGITFAGRVENIDPAYARCTATIVPVFYGGGTRVKAIEASLHHRPCISTEIGVEGLDLENGVSYFRAETAEDWITTLTSLTPELARDVGSAAFSRIRQTYDPDRVAERFEQAVRQALETSDI